MADNVFQLDCWFEGHVQGVGFRYQTTRVAMGFEVSGTVRNLADGRVHLFAEGEEPEVLAFADAVEEELSNYIKRVERRSQLGPRQHAGFRIAR